MREILFRGKRLCNNKWMMGSLLCYEDGDCHICCDNFGLNHYRVDPKTVGQFIGLTDKNGKKIFEGDIMSERGCLFVVVYDTKWARFKLQHIGRGIQYPEWNRGVQMEIVGNIHDNPELLEG